MLPTTPTGQVFAGHPPENETTGFTFEGQFGPWFDIAIICFHALPHVSSLVALLAPCRWLWSGVVRSLSS
jgi:hypothetical protein